MKDFNKRLTLEITNRVGTMTCAIIFAVIGIMGITGALTNNSQLVLVIGAVSGYFLQLVLLPIIMVGQNIQSEKFEKHIEKMMSHMSSELDRIVIELKNDNQILEEILNKRRK